MVLTRDEILGRVDIATKAVEVPEWGGSIYIRQLTRGEQDVYLKRQYGNTQLKQDTRAKNQEIKGFNIYGHDAFICSMGICDEQGQSIFTQKDIVELDKKSGVVVGRLAKEIVEFSGMSGDVEELDELKN